MPYGSKIFYEISKKCDNLKKINIIDGHSHIGHDCFWPVIGEMNEYIDNLKIRYISEANIMSVPSPVIESKNGSKILLYHETSNKIIHHYQVNNCGDERQVIEIKKNENPYKEANELIYSMVKKENGIKLNYVPLIHPYYYSLDDFLDNISKGAVAFKIHGIACGVDPKQISEEFFKMIESLGVPLIIHTDYSPEENLLSVNSSWQWLQCLAPYNIKVFFAHAARLNDKAISTINGDDRYVVGIGPDMLLNNDGMNEVNCENYLDYCLEKFDINKICFDIDYPWNLKCLNEKKFDWDSLYRFDLSFDEMQKVFEKNIKKIVLERKK